jgi:hypothetical protein
MRGIMIKPAAKEPRMPPAVLIENIYPVSSPLVDETRANIFMASGKFAPISAVGRNIIRKAIRKR